jgi:general secretion pathway protein A
LLKNPYFRFFSFFGLRENPFAVSPDPKYIFTTPEIQESWEALLYGVRSHSGIILLTGEAGTGKTTLINRLLDWLRERHMPTAFIFNSHLERRHLFDFMLADFGVKSDPRWQGNALLGLSQWLPQRCQEGEIPVLIVDEAQGLPLHMLEEIRQLLNLETSHEKLLQIVLAGQPELEEKLNQPEMRHLKQRITLRCTTAPLNAKETEEYIQVRLKIAGASDRPIFTPEAMSAVHAYSHGIPRVINLLCEHSLINAYAANLHVVPARFVGEVAREFQFDQDVSIQLISGVSSAPVARIYEPLNAAVDSLAAFPAGVPVPISSIPSPPDAVSMKAPPLFSEVFPAPAVPAQLTLVPAARGVKSRGIRYAKSHSGPAVAVAAVGNALVAKSKEAGFAVRDIFAKMRSTRIPVGSLRGIRPVLVKKGRDLQSVFRHARAKIVNTGILRHRMGSVRARAARATQLCTAALSEQGKSFQILWNDICSATGHSRGVLLRWFQQPFEPSQATAASAPQMHSQTKPLRSRKASRSWEHPLERLRLRQLSVQFSGNAPVRQWLRQPFHFAQSFRSVSRFVPRHLGDSSAVRKQRE